jgi:hypothetical protein
MKAAAYVLLMIGAISGCSADRGTADLGRTTRMFPDCDQVSAEEQRRGRCMRRPDMPDGL